MDDEGPIIWPVMGPGKVTITTEEAEKHTVRLNDAPGLGWPCGILFYVNKGSVKIVGNGDKFDPLWRRAWRYLRGRNNQL